MQTQNKKSDKRVWALMAIVFLVMVLIILFLLWQASLQKKQMEPTPTPPPSQGFHVDPNATEGGLVTKSKEEIQEELNEKVAMGMINISMNTSPVFPTGDSEGNLLIVNADKNNYPQVVYIVRKDTGEEIYRSGGIPVGSKIEKAKLAVDLDPGTYECVAYFNNVDAATGTFLGTAGAEIVVTVQG